MTELEDIQQQYIQQQKAIAGLLGQVDTSVFFSGLIKEELERGTKTSYVYAKRNTRRLCRDLETLRRAIKYILTR